MNMTEIGWVKKKERSWSMQIEAQKAEVDGEWVSKLSCSWD